MSYYRYQTADWLVVYNALRLHRVHLPLELFVKRPWAILHGLDRLDALQTIEAGEMPNPIEPPMPEWWDAVYDLCPFDSAGISREAFKAAPWPILLSYRLEAAPRRLYRCEGGGDDDVDPGDSGGGGVSASSASAALGASKPTRSASTRSNPRPSKGRSRRGFVRRVTDALAITVAGLYPLVRASDDRWRLDRSRIAASAGRYSVRLFILALAAAFAYGLAHAVGESLMVQLSMLAVMVTAVTGMARVRGVEASVKG
ncbi:hypothetical protein V6X63_10200 [Spiribacter sp. 221]|uniref:hypothetical protein n=1 Tax=Spiribacter onubensis TaxID=3122420 RepID=UPI00349F8323